MKSQIKYILTPITVLALVAVGACMNGRVWKSQERTIIVAMAKKYALSNSVTRLNSVVVLTYLQLVRLV